MRASDERFQELMQRVKAGSETAIGELVNEYSGQILRAIRGQLHRAMRQQFDSQDFSQAVWASFFRHKDRLGDFDAPSELVAFLVRVARNKVIDECRRRLMSQGKNVNRVRPLNGDVPAPRPNDSAPDEQAQAREQFDRLVAGQPPDHRKVVELRAGGATYEEIAQIMGKHESTIRRVIRRLEREVGR